MIDHLNDSRTFFVLAAGDAQQARTQPDAKRVNYWLFTVLHVMASGMRDLVDGLDAIHQKLAAVEAQLNRPSLVRRP